MTADGTTRLARPILVFGGSGQVGREIVRVLASSATIVAPTSADVNLTDPDRIRRTIRDTRPAAIINAAALTNVDRAEREPELARALNETAPATMAEEARRVQALLVHYSTDYVFDGARDTPYEEDVLPHPINVYGRTKLAGERAIVASHAAHVIIRTSWVYSRDGTGFVGTLLRQLPLVHEVRVVADQVGSPTWSRSLALATTAMLDAMRRGDVLGPVAADCGVYHLGGSGAASRVEIATELISAVAERANGEATHSIAVIPISAADFDAPARRPRYSALANVRARERFGIVLPSWQADLRSMLVTES